MQVRIGRVHRVVAAIFGIAALHHGRSDAHQRVRGDHASTFTDHGNAIHPGHVPFIEHGDEALGDLAGRDGDEHSRDNRDHREEPEILEREQQGGGREHSDLGAARERHGDANA